MTTPTNRDWPDTRRWRDPRGHGQSPVRYQGRYPCPSPPESSDPSTSLDTDPSEDPSSDPEYVAESIPEFTGENSPHSLSELGLRDHSDPGPEGSRHGQVERMSTDPSDSSSSERHHPAHFGDVGPNRSRSPSVTSRRRYPERETQLGGPRRTRERSRPSRSDREETRPNREEAPRGNTGDRVVRQLRDLVGSMRERRLPRERHVSPPSPPDFLKMVMMMQSMGTQKFFGDRGPVESDSWLKHVERNFSAIRCPNEFKTDVAVHYLLRDACHWWDNVKVQYPRAPIAWDSFKREFERKYFPPEARDRMETQFQNLVQGERSVRHYEAEFTRLRQYAHFGVFDEPAVIRKFLRGLRPQLMSRLMVNQYHSLFELVERAVDVEEGIRIEQEAEDRVGQRTQERPPGPVNQVVRPGQGTPGRGRGQGQGRGQNWGRGQGRGAAGRGTPTMDQLPVCYNCGGRGHIARACPKGGQAARPVPSTVVCFTCNQPGHYATSCPVTHPTGQNNQRVGLRAMEWEDEPIAKRPAIEGRVYSLDKPEPSQTNKGPVSGN